MAVSATILSAVLPPLILGMGFTGPSFIRIVLLPVVLGAISLTAHVVSNAVLRQRLQLENQDKELQELLAASENPPAPGSEELPVFVVDRSSPLPPARLVPLLAPLLKVALIPITSTPATFQKLQTSWPAPSRQVKVPSSGFR